MLDQRQPVIGEDVGRIGGGIVRLARLCRGRAGPA